MKFESPSKIFADESSRKGLPAWTYNNEELTELEMEQVFLSNWLFVGHVSDMPRTGDYQCLTMGNERAVVVRDQQGELRAFHNLCSHRASRIVSEDKGHCGKAFICPFHGWSYNLDGSVKNIPRESAFPDIDKKQLGLKTLDCEVWHGLIFVRFGGDGPSVAQQFAEVGLSRAWGSFEGRKHKSEQVQNYVDALPEESYLPESHRHLWVYLGTFPGFVLTLFPDQIEVYQIYSAGPQKSVMAGVTYALADSRKSMHKARKFNRDINMEVGDEDIRLIEWAAQGMRSSAFEQVVLSDLELGVAAFQNQLRENLPVVSLPQAPPQGSLAKVNASMLTKAKVAAVR